MARTFKPLQSGELRFVGNLEKLIDSVDSAQSPGTQYEVWAPDVRFAIGDWKSNESVQQNMVMGTLITLIVMRWRPGLEGVQPNVMRLVHKVDLSISPPVVDYYDIQGVIRDRTARTGLQLLCVKRDAPGFRTGTIP